MQQNNENIKKRKRLIIVSNRLPFTIREVNGEIEFTESTGGLVTGIGSYLNKIGESHPRISEYLWIGWPGTTIDESKYSIVKEKGLKNYKCFPVFMSINEMENFYHGFCNKTIWPLFHSFPSYTTYDENYWKIYKNVNEQFCTAVIETAKPDDIIWINDYHLMLLPRLIKLAMPNLPVGFFLHIPFPTYEIFRLLPGLWRQEILEGLLGSDLVGFHTHDYMQYFLQCTMRILGYEHTLGKINMPGMVVLVKTFPMGIEYKKFSTAKDNPEIVAEADIIKKTFGDVKIILSIDRLDYTKGILNRLLGFERLLIKYPELEGKVTLCMVVVPSRVAIEHYELMKKQIEENVGRINGKFSTLNWRPIIYQYRYIPFNPLSALYLSGDVALVTPLRDGMNLVAKEYVATRADKRGVLILSETAGAAKELGEAIIINPNNIEEIATAIKEALDMSEEEQARRMEIMQNRLERYNVIRWANDIIESTIESGELQSPLKAKILSNINRNQIFDNLLHSKNSLLFLDYDGTLVPLARRPQMAKPNKAIITLLESISRITSITTVIISGRDKNTMDKWFGNLMLNFVAEHGAWIKEKGSEWKVTKEFSNSWKQTIMPILEHYVDQLPGALLEEKEYSLSWHYRAADPDQSAQTARELIDHLRVFTANIDLQILQGKKVIEIRSGGINKGIAAQYWLSKVNPEFILAIGDDWTDEDLFAALPEKAYSIKVGLAETNARYSLKSTLDVINLLSEICKLFQPTQ